MSKSKPFSELVRQRLSCRHYKPDAVPKEAIRLCLEAARLAPSACNQQPWFFSVVTDAELRARIVEKGFKRGIAMHWAVEAPVHIVVGMQRKTITHRLAVMLSGIDFPWIDIGIAGEHLVLQATELGLGSCWIGWIRPERIRGLLNWPRLRLPVAVITLGYAAEPLPQPRPRRPLNEISD